MSNRESEASLVLQHVQVVQNDQKYGRCEIVIDGALTCRHAALQQQLQLNGVRPTLVNTKTLSRFVTGSVALLMR